MLRIKDLLFFDKNGGNFGFVFDENAGTWGGTIYIDSVSRGLYETQRIALVQRYPLYAESENIDGTSSTDSPLLNPTYTYIYGKPSSDTPNGRFVFEWDDSTKEVDEIRLYGIDDTEPCEQTPDTTSLVFDKYTCPNIKFVDSVVVDNLYCDPYSPQVNRVSFTPPYKDEYTYNCLETDVLSFIDICFCNTDDQYNTFRRDLMLYYEDGSSDGRRLVGKFSVYAESIEEDERLSVLCANLGYDINNADFSIFKDTDIKEELIDYDFINLKRKEILMEGHNIYPHIGSYKSVINAIRFFGYDNVSIKEWWKNVNIGSQDYGKYFIATSYSLEDKEVIRGKSSITLPNKNFRKTPKITLAYKINKSIASEDAQSSYEGHGYPMTEECFDYTIEEAVIKLYGLKRKLDKEFLPMTTRIVDIVGESDAFYVNTLRHVMTANMTENTYAGVPVDFDILNGDDDGMFYLEDLRPFGLHSEEDPNWEGFNMVGETSATPQFIGGSLQSLISANPNASLQQLGVVPLQGLNTNYETGTDTYWHSTLFPVAGDRTALRGLQDVFPQVVPPNELYPRTLRSGYGEHGGYPWEFYQFYIDELENRGETHTNYFLANFSDYFPNLNKKSVPANTFDYDSAEYLPDTEYAVSGALVRLVFKDGEHCSRIQWDIYKAADENTDEFHAHILGMWTDGYGDIGVVLPYVGTYDVVMTVYGYDNSISVKSKQNCITVEPKTVEITGWCVMAREYCGWDSDLCWDDATFEWRLPIVNDSSVADNKSASYESMDRATFIGEYADEQDPDSSMYYYEFDDTYTGLQGITDPIGYGDRRLCSVGAYYWDNIQDSTWDGLSHLWWDAMCISGDLPAYIDFGYFDLDGRCMESEVGANDTLLGNWLEIVTADYRYGAFRFPTAIGNPITQIADLVRLLNDSEDPVIGRYHYSWVYDYANTIPSNEPVGFKITGVAKTANRSADIIYAGIVDTAHHATTDNDTLIIRNNESNPQRKQFRFASNTLSYNPNWVNCVYINNVTRIPRYTDVNFNYSNCKIVGKKNPHWKITNLNTGTVYESDRKNYHRLFRERGCYEIALTLEDNNGNTYSTRRNLLIIE